MLLLLVLLVLLVELLPACCSRFTSCSLLIPSGVSSKAQANISTGGRQSAKPSMKTRITQSGAAAASRTRSNT